MPQHQYYSLGHSGLRVSRLSLGTMTFGTEWGWGSDQDTARAIFNRYIDSGGNLLDTADMYTGGVSEQWVGEFIKERNLRDQVIVTTKFSFNTDPANPNSGGNGRKNIMRAVDASLIRLKTDYIDLYLLHNWDKITPVEEVMRTFEDLVRAGKIRYAGLSNVPSWYASRAQTIAEFRGSEPIAALQMAYSLTNRNIEAEYVALGTQYGMGIMAWSPLGGGLLSGKYKPSETGKFGQGRLQDVKHPAFAEFSARNFAIVAEVENIARELGRSMSQIAINWAANRPGVATVIVGATKLAQLNDNLQALDFAIPEELVARLDATSAVELPYPYNYFEPIMQAPMVGASTVGDKPPGYNPSTLIVGESTNIPQD
ncbi:MAG: aldo/keto reductase [Porticoccaceae bacterium]|nr:aldo/keto reductase [Porticoccaceae bacterium]